MQGFCNLSAMFAISTMKSLVLLVAICNWADAQIGIPQIISLLDSVNDTMEKSLKNQEANQNHTTMILSQLVDSQVQIANTQAQMASTQAEMANTLNQVILILKGKLLSLLNVWKL